MSTNKEDIKSELKKLSSKSRLILYSEFLDKGSPSEENIRAMEENEKFIKFRKEKDSTQSEYQQWYTKASSVIKQIAPDRYKEFCELYKLEKRPPKSIDFTTYTISDYLIGLKVSRGYEEVVNPFTAFFSKFESQIAILDSCITSIDSKLTAIEGVLQYELFENELEASKDLLKKKHLRVAGVLAGVTLETHLKSICNNRGITFRKKNPTIADFNEELKGNEIIDIPTWRHIQRLGDIRNLCAHPKDREPKTDEVEDLIRGTEKVISEIF